MRSSRSVFQKHSGGVQLGVDVSVQHTGQYLDNDHRSDVELTPLSCVHRFCEHLRSLQASETVSARSITMMFSRSLLFVSHGQCDWRTRRPPSKSLLLDSWALRSSVRRTSIIARSQSGSVSPLESGINLIWGS